MSWNEKGLAEIITKEFLLEEHFEKGKSIRQIARELDCGKTNILGYMKRFELTPQKQKYNQHGRKYQYNDNFFEVIDTEDKAYWLGFIMADGYTLHTKKQKRLRIALGEKDKDHLNKFLFAIDSDIPINYDGNNPYVDVNSTKMCDDLSKYGIVPNKSAKETLPDLPEHLVHHFIRGLFDGDGSWVTRNHGKYTWFTFDQKAGLDMCVILKSYFESYGVTFPPSALVKCEGIYSLRCYKKEDVLKIRDIMYEDATIYLDRKYEKAVG